MEILPILLAGGSGSRLSPVSTNTKPKQFIEFNDYDSGFVNAILRALKINEKNIIIVTLNAYKDLVANQIQLLEKKYFQNTGTKYHIILEPCAQNTAAAALLGSFYANKTFPGSLGLLMPTDHAILEKQIFKDNVLSTIANFITSKDPIITFSNNFQRADHCDYFMFHENYSELHLCTQFIPRTKVFEFNNKPEYKTGINFGIYLFNVEHILKQFAIHAYSTYAYISAALKNAHYLKNYVFLNYLDYHKIPRFTFEEALITKLISSQNIAMKECDFTWADVGTMDALWDQFGSNGEIIFDNRAADPLEIREFNRLSKYFRITELNNTLYIKKKGL